MADQTKSHVGSQVIITDLHSLVTVLSIKIGGSNARLIRSVRYLITAAYVPNDTEHAVVLIKWMDTHSEELFQVACSNKYVANCRTIGGETFHFGQQCRLFVLFLDSLSWPTYHFLFTFFCCFAFSVVVPIYPASTPASHCTSVHCHCLVIYTSASEQTKMLGIKFKKVQKQE